MKKTIDANDATLLAHAGRSKGHFGAVNVPVYHASTILFPTLHDYENKSSAPVRYGRRGTPTTQALEAAMSELEHAAGTVLTPSGLSAITTSLLAYAKPGADFLITDSVYEPARNFLGSMGQKLGVNTRFYDPTIGERIGDLIKPETALVWIESPGSHTFEVQDLSAIARVARKHGVTTVIDNSWSGGHFLKPLDHGIDISLQAATKYIGGHSDVMLGTISCSEATLPLIRGTASALGLCVGPDDAYLGLRGLRTLTARLAAHHANGIAVAKWLESRPEILRVIHPALPSHAQHDLWKRQFSGASGLFAFILKETDRKKLAAMLDGMKYFGMGSSWGGYESLLIPIDPTLYRTATAWHAGGQMMRIHVGLEDPADLISDLEAGLRRLG